MRVIVVTSGLVARIIEMLRSFSVIIIIREKLRLQGNRRTERTRVTRRRMMWSCYPVNTWWSWGIFSSG